MLFEDWKCNAVQGGVESVWIRGTGRGQNRDIRSGVLPFGNGGLRRRWYVTEHRTRKQIYECQVCLHYFINLWFALHLLRIVLTLSTTPLYIYVCVRVCYVCARVRMSVCLSVCVWVCLSLVQFKWYSLPIHHSRIWILNKIVTKSDNNI